MDSRSIEISDEIASLHVFLKSVDTLELRLTVSIGIFTKIYLKQVRQSSAPQQILWFFGDLLGFFEYVQEYRHDRSKIIIHPDTGVL